MHSVVLNSAQITILRLMLRLQLIRSLRMTLGSYRQGTASESYALNYSLGFIDRHEAADMTLRLVEEKMLQNRQPAFELMLDEATHSELSRIVDFPYSTAQIPDGDQADAGRILKLIQDEREGLRMAFSLTEATPVPNMTTSGKFRQ